MLVTTYVSDSYLVLTGESGTEVTHQHSGHTQRFEGEAGTAIVAAIALVPERVPMHLIETVTDHYLSQFFGVL